MLRLTSGSMMQERPWYSLIGKTGAKSPSRPRQGRTGRGQAPWLAEQDDSPEVGDGLETTALGNGAGSDPNLRRPEGAEGAGPAGSSSPGIRSQYRSLAGYAEAQTESTRGTSSMDEGVKAIARPAASRSLRDAIRKARVEEAENLDVAADHRDSEIARLELLKAELEPIFAEIPPQDDRFNLTLVPSRPARLWIDLFTYATIDERSGAYLFVRNSENGRRTMFSATNVADMADRITSYIAREIVRRERMEAALVDQNTRQRQPIGEQTNASHSTMVLMAFVIGVLTGAAGLFAAVWLSAT